ncbi:MAG: hypothetical protein QOI95_3090 [Acidimicrobiaceae bacterium]|jgi:hypothetical protein
MRSFRNPFRSRTSEQQQQQGLQRFLRTYGADVLDLLPEELWDRPVIVRSAPGGGKTSLLRAFTVDALQAIAARPDEFDDLHRRMSDVGAIESGLPRVLGVRVALSQGYRDLMDLGVEPEVSRKLFFRLLDAHIVRAVCEAASLLTGLKFPDDLAALEFAPAAATAELLERLGGFDGEVLFNQARRADSEIHDLLDSVLPISWEGVSGHAALLSLRAFSGVEIRVDGREQRVLPLIMFDDGQDLAVDQRTALLEALADRKLDLSRWYTERYSALTPEEVIGDGEPGRGHVVVPLEFRARTMAGQIRNGRKVRPYESMLIDVANRRASKPLADYGDETETNFSEFLDVDEHDQLDQRSSEIIPVLRQRVIAIASGRNRYQGWLDDAEELYGYDAALRWRELEIVIIRDRDRGQLELIDLPLTNEDLKAQSASNIREAAALFLRHDYRLPYYFGSQRISKLASQNVEQFLVLSGSMFEDMLALITLRRRPWLDATSQDRIVRATSEAMWRAIPQRRSYGRDIQHLLLRIAGLAQRDTYRPKAPYAPGVTGTALSMRDRARLLDPAVRERIPGADALFRALAGAIGHNLLSAELDRSVKNNRWMVLYLNRMLCARFNLPIGYGGFRERPLEDMCAWMAEPISGDLSGIELPPSLFDS